MGNEQIAGKRKDGTVMEDARNTLNCAVVPASGFHPGDRVFLAKGPHQGTAGIFQHVTSDPKWAEILEQQDSTIRAHPVEWLALSR
jgi:hypothetical protein